MEATKAQNWAVEPQEKKKKLSHTPYLDLKPICIEQNMITIKFTMT
jgi:hypothetical protein